MKYVFHQAWLFNAANKVDFQFSHWSWFWFSDRSWQLNKLRSNNGIIKAKTQLSHLNLQAMRYMLTSMSSNFDFEAANGSGNRVTGFACWNPARTSYEDEFKIVSENFSNADLHNVCTFWYLLNHHINNLFLRKGLCLISMKVREIYVYLVMKLTENLENDDFAGLPSSTRDHVQEMQGQNP